MKRPKIGLIGCGNWGKHILRDLNAIGCEVYVVARSKETQKRAEEGGAKKIASSIEQLTHMDGFVVAVHTIDHARIVFDLLDRGVPLFVEKPLCVSGEDAKRLVQLAADRLFVMDLWRYHSGVEMLKAIAQSKELGRVLGIKTFNRRWGNPHKDVDGVWILLPHELAIILEILGEIPLPRHAIAEMIEENPQGLTAILGNTEQLMPSVFGPIGVQIPFPHPANCQQTDVWAHIDFSLRAPVKNRKVSLHCEKGIAFWEQSDAGYVQVVQGEDASNWEKRPISLEYPLFRELKAFVDFLAGGSPPKSNALDGALIVERVEEIRDLAGLPRSAAELNHSSI